MPAFLVADDHIVLRQGLRLILNREFPNAVIGEAATAEDVMKQLTGRHWDLLVLDISMPGEGGLGILREVGHIRPSQNILILSMHPESEFGIRALRAGALGYITKSASGDDLIRAIRATMKGQRYISMNFAASIAVDLNRADGPPHQSLSDREYEIMRAIAAGSAVGEIAANLSLSSKTVSTYRRRVLAKLKLNTNADLTRYAIENNLI